MKLKTATVVITRSVSDVVISVLVGGRRPRLPRWIDNRGNAADRERLS